MPLSPEKKKLYQRELMRRRRQGLTGSNKEAESGLTGSNIEPLPGQTRLDGFAPDIPESTELEEGIVEPLETEEEEAETEIAKLPPKRPLPAAPAISPVSDQLPQESESSLPDPGELAPPGKVEFRIVRVIEDPDEVVQETERRLATQGWAMWTCANMNNEKMIILRDEWVTGYPEGIPAYVEEEWHRLMKLPLERISYINELKKFNPGTKYLETILKGAK